MISSQKVLEKNESNTVFRLRDNFQWAVQTERNYQVELKGSSKEVAQGELNQFFDSLDINVARGKKHYHELPQKHGAQGHQLLHLTRVKYEISYLQLCLVEPLQALTERSYRKHVIVR